MRGTVEKVDRGVGRRAAANKAKFTYSSDDEDDYGGAKAGSSSKNNSGDVETFDIKDDSDSGDAFDRIVADDSRTTANGSSGKKERDSSPILDSDDDDDDFVSKPSPGTNSAVEFASFGKCFIQFGLIS